MPNQSARIAIATPERVAVEDAFLSKLYRAELSEIPDLVDGLAMHLRVALAGYCNSRTHLRAMARVIASRCDDTALLQYAGRAIGASLISAKRSFAEERLGAYGNRPKVTLARKADMTRRFPGPDDEASEDDSAA